jgi:hypothetical protein
MGFEVQVTESEKNSSQAVAQIEKYQQERDVHMSELSQFRKCFSLYLRQLACNEGFNRDVTSFAVALLSLDAVSDSVENGELRIKLEQSSASIGKCFLLDVELNPEFAAKAKVVMMRVLIVIWQGRPMLIQRPGWDDSTKVIASMKSEGGPTACRQSSCRQWRPFRAVAQRDIWQ